MMHLQIVCEFGSVVSHPDFSHLNTDELQIQTI